MRPRLVVEPDPETLAMLTRCMARHQSDGIHTDLTPEERALVTAVDTTPASGMSLSVADPGIEGARRLPHETLVPSLEEELARGLTDAVSSR